MRCIGDIVSSLPSLPNRRAIHQHSTSRKVCVRAVCPNISGRSSGRNMDTQPRLHAQPPPLEQEILHNQVVGIAKKSRQAPVRDCGHVSPAIFRTRGCQTRSVTNSPGSVALAGPNCTAAWDRQVAPLAFAQLRCVASDILSSMLSKRYGRCRTRKQRNRQLE